MYQKFHGEVQRDKHVDQVMREYFPNYDYKGIFFDVGAYEPVNISNSYHFEKNGWETYCFEANTDRISELKSLRKNVYNVAISDENKDNITFHVVQGIWGGGSETAGVSAITLDPQYMRTFGSHIKKIDKITVNQRTLNYLIENEIGQSSIPQIDILSVDVEGGELAVLKGLDLIKYNPKLICVENVFNNPDIKNYLESYNYKLDKQIEYNHYYIKN